MENNKFENTEVKETSKNEKKSKYTLEELLKGITKENRHEEIITDIQGRELI